MKKILVISDKLFPDEVGGSCTVAYELIKKWEQNYIVDIFTCYPDKKDNDKFFKGQVYRLLNKKHPIKSAKALRNILNNNYDIILTHTVLTGYILYKAKNYDINKVYTVYHGPWSREAKLKYEGGNKKIFSLVLPKIYKTIEKKYAKVNKNFIFLSEYMKNELNSIYPLKDKNIYYVDGGINLSNYKREYTKEEARALLGLPQDKYIVFSLRRLEKRMGLQIAVDAIKTHNKEKNDILFLIGGKGPFKDNLEKQIDRDSNIKLLGFVKDEDIPKYFIASDLFLVPSIDLEGFGLVNIEALAYGVPVLATPQGGMIDLKKKLNNMYLTSDISSESIRKSLNEFINKGVKSPVNEDLKDFDWQIIADKYLEIFKLK